MQLRVRVNPIPIPIPYSSEETVTEEEQQVGGEGEEQQSVAPPPLPPPNPHPYPQPSTSSQEVGVGGEGVGVDKSKPPVEWLPSISFKGVKRTKVNSSSPDVATAVCSVNGRVCGFKKGSSVVCDLYHHQRTFCPDSVDRIIRESIYDETQVYRSISVSRETRVQDQRVTTLVEGDKVKKMLRRSWSKSRKRQVFLEADVLSCFEAGSLVGNKVRVYWANDRQWYEGKITKLTWLPGSQGSRDYMKCKHLVQYFDGEKEELFLGEERISLQVDLFVQNANRGAMYDANHPQQMEFFRVNGKRLLQFKRRKNSVCLQRRGQRYLRIVNEGHPMYSLGQLLWMKRKGAVFPGVVMSWEHIDECLEQNMFHKSVPLAIFGSGELLVVSVDEVFEEVPERDFVDGEALKQLMDLLDFGHMPLWLDHGRWVKHAQARVKVEKLRSVGDIASGESVEDDEDEEETESDIESSEEDDEEEDSSSGRKKNKRILNRKIPPQKRKREADKPTPNKSFRSDPQFVSGSYKLRAPWYISKSLIVHNLGEIECFHPHFHTERVIYPVSFRIEHITHSPWGGDKEIIHFDCQILKGEDGGPLFKMQLGKGRVAQGSSLRNLQKDLEKQFSPDKTLFGAFTEWIYGFQSSRLRKVIHSLPNAGLCERFKGWIGGPPPDLPAVDRSIIIGRRAAYARMQKLPEGVKPQPYVAPKTIDGYHRCHVCGHLEFEDDLFLECDRCRIVVHMSCYGVCQRPDGQLWLCDVCEMRLERPQPCLLCPVVGGPMKITKKRNWCHIVCALWVPEVSFEDVDLKEPILGAEKVAKKKSKHRCSICKQYPSGSLLQCSVPKCYQLHHPSCARIHGLIMEFDEEHQEYSGNQQDQQQVQQSPTLQNGGHAQQPQQGLQTQLSGKIKFVSLCRRHTKERIKDTERVVMQNYSTTDNTIDSKGDETTQVSYDNKIDGCIRSTPIEILRILNKKVRKVVSYAGIGLQGDPRSRARLEKLQCSIDLAQLEKQQENQQLAQQEEYQSAYQRFCQMRESVVSRVGFGKSPIHCWGGFAKKKHKAGDMIIEYVGEIIRPAVADMRERQTYNDKVGGGTYIFRMNATKCVDATVTGNIAGLLNHSCNPNCYSKTISIKHPDGEEAEDHVLIVAKRDIEPEEELTYDYRYAGEQSLSCNCGAQGCRQVVNFLDRDCELLAPRSQLISAANEIDTSRIPLYEQFNFNP